MKTEFAIYAKKPLISWPTSLMLILLGIVMIIVIAFFKWFRDQAQPLNLSIVIEYLQYTLKNFPIYELQADHTQLILIYIVSVIVIDYLKTQIKLVITPDKIYYRLWKMPLSTFIQRQEVEYCQFAILGITRPKWISWMQRPIFQTANKANPQLLFFPLKNVQSQLHLACLSEHEKGQLIQILKQYYNFQDDIAALTLSQEDLQNLILQTKISPRIAYLLIGSVPIGILGLYLNAQAQFFYISNYPVLLCLAIIFLLIFIPSVLWIQKDIPKIAFTGSMLSSTFLTLSLSFFLMPVLHSYYALHFGTHKMTGAQLLSMDAGGQKWRLLDNQQTFYILPKTPFYNPNLKTHEIYEFPIYYHWHNYHFQHSELALVQLKTKTKPG
ncbi:hypothetical protein D9K80_11785 [Acinetobacter cumulans]|uniref:Uncharacterized protein n=1 Tax=Acinetobacter cumulans TaxID=2136182 RepID=A0A498DA70_9GAMM|nr:hypothetical protein [Acinetobacter cumulans]RLL34143.1 hypothetical protein D9K80_11785 [Acinetobacter cumulans]